LGTWAASSKLSFHLLANLLYSVSILRPPHQPSRLFASFSLEEWNKSVTKISIMATSASFQLSKVQQIDSQYWPKKGSLWAENNGNHHKTPDCKRLESKPDCNLRRRFSWSEAFLYVSSFHSTHRLCILNFVHLPISYIFIEFFLHSHFSKL